MFIDLDKAINVKMLGKCTHEKGFWHDHNDQPQKHQSISSNNFIYVTEGSFNMIVNDNMYNVSQGDVLVIPANITYQPRESDGCSYYYLHFMASAIDDPPAANIDKSLLRFNETPNIGYGYNYYGSSYNSIIEVPFHIEQNKFNMNHKISDVMNRATKINVWQNRNEKLLLDNIMRELLILSSTALSSEQPKNNTLQKILLYINNHYTEPITLTSLADTFEISASYITKLFRTYLDKGTVDYINDLRLSSACEYLISSNYSVGQISNMVGFSNQYYFDRIFKKRYGITPKDFRKNKL